MRFLLIGLLLLPRLANATNETELMYLELLNYRINMIVNSTEIANTLKEILNEQRLIRCKIEPIEQDCFERETQENKVN